MSNLLNKKEYISIAEKIKFPVDPYIDGKFQKSKAGRVMETINPATGSVITNIAACLCGCWIVNGNRPWHLHSDHELLLHYQGFHLPPPMK